MSGSEEQVLNFVCWSVIVFVNDKRQVKVANSLSWPMENTNIQKALDKTNTYIAPEDLARIQRGEFFEEPSELS